MLRKNQVVAILPLAEMLNDRDIHLTSYTDTGLGELVIASNTQLDEIHADGVADTLVEMTSSQTVSDAAAEGNDVVLGSDHSRIKANLVNTLAAGVRRVVGGARNTITPAIRAAREEIDRRIGDAASLLAITPETRIFSYDDVWESVTVDGIATRHEDTPHTMIPASLQLPAITSEQANALATAGGTELSAFLTKYKETHDVGQLYDAWFRGQSHENPYAVAVNNHPAGLSVESVKDSVGRLIDFVDAPIVAYIMANNLLDNPPEGTTASSMDQYNADIAAALNHFGKVIGNIYTQRDMAAKSGLLVMQYPDASRWATDGIRGDLVLNADTYRGYLEGENKGDIETILGSMFSDNPSNNADTIKSMASKYKGAWDSTLNTFKLTEASRVSQAKMAALSLVVTDHIRNIPDDVWDGMHQDTNKGSVIQGFLAWLSKDVPIPSTSVEMDNILISVFCDFIYPSLNAGEFIRRMNTYPNQNLEPNVIATHVVMEMLVSGMLAGVSYN